PGLKFSNNETFAKNKTNPTKVEMTDVQSLTLSIDSGSVVNFNKMKRIQIFTGGGVLQDKLIASHDVVQSNETVISLKFETTDEEYKEVMKKDLYELKLMVEWQVPIEDPIYLKFNMRFRIKSSPVK